MLGRLGLPCTRLARDKHHLISVLLPEREIRFIRECINVGWKLADRNIFVLKDLSKKKSQRLHENG